MNYSKLVEAIKNDDKRLTNTLCAELHERLKNYLIATAGAPPELAEDSVQNMFEYLIPKIRRDEITSPSGILRYMQTGVRHNYLKLIRKKESISMDADCDMIPVDPEQVWELVDREKREILAGCIGKLTPHYKELIEFLMVYPNAEPEDMASKFNISVSNVWVRRHRAIKLLNECVTKKLSCSTKTL